MSSLVPRMHRAGESLQASALWILTSLFSFLVAPFGEGVQDNETLPYFVGHLASKYQPYNYGVNGYGPQQMVAKLQQGEIRREIKQPEGVSIYTFIDDHMYRMIGSQYVVAQNWGRYRPYYGLDSNGNLERRGNFLSGRPGLALLFWLLGKSEVARYFRIGVRQPIGDNDFSLIAKMFAESRNAFSRIFNSEKFFVLIYPGSTSAKKLVPYLQRNGVQYFDYSTLFDPAQRDLTIKGDPHPTPKAYRIVAERLTQDLGILDETTMNGPGLSTRTKLALRWSMPCLLTRNRTSLRQDVMFQRP